MFKPPSKRTVGSKVHFSWAPKRLLNAALQDSCNYSCINICTQQILWCWRSFQCFFKCQCTCSRWEDWTFKLHSIYWQFCCTDQRKFCIKRFPLLKGPIPYLKWIKVTKILNVYFLVQDHHKLYLCVQ